MYLRHLQFAGCAAFTLVCLTPAFAQTDLQIKSVLPEKLYYKPGDPVSIKIEISNPTKAAVSADLQVELIHDLDRAEPVAPAGAVTVEPNGSKVLEFKSTAKPHLGNEVRAVLTRDGKAIASKSEYFTCAANFFQVLIPGLGGMLMSGNIPPDKVDAQNAYTVNMYRSYYGNYYEQFAWAPSDYDDMTPEVDRWWAGQAQYSESKTNMLSLGKALEAQGIQWVTYGKAAGGGPLTFEFLRKHPEYASYYDGRPSLENYDAGFLDYISTIGPPKLGDVRGLPGQPEEMEKAGYTGAAWFAPFIKVTSNWCSVWYDSNHPEVLKHGCEEMGKSSLLFGFKGVRFDGEYFSARHRTLDGNWNAPENFDTDAADTKLVRDMKKWTWAIRPGYQFAYNTYLSYRWNIAANNTPQEFREKCKDGGLIAREELTAVGNVPWTDYIKTVRHNSDIARYYGGYMASYPFFRNPRFLYCTIIPNALRAHTMFGFVGKPDTADPKRLKPEVNRFVTRNASLLWDDGVHAWAQAGDEIQVKSNRNLWWREFAATRPMGDGKNTQFILHLINPPESKTTYGAKNDADPYKVPEDGMPAAPARDVEVRWVKPRGFKRAVVMDLDREDLQVLASRVEGNQVVVSVPDVAHWSILVLEAETATPVPVYTVSAEEANLKTPTAQELGLAVSVENPNSWRYVMQGEDYFCNDGTASRELDLDAKGGAGMRTRQIGKRGYMAVGTYLWPKLVGHYNATFRMKVADNTSDKPVVTLQVQHIMDAPPAGVRYSNSGNLVLKGTDFEAPNTYQEFKLPFEHPDIGFHGVMLLYEGNNDLTWDQIDIQFEKPWAPAELEAYYAGMTPPADLAMNADGAKDVLFIRGLWNRSYRLEETIPRLGTDAKVSNAYCAYSQTVGTKLTGFTLDWPSLYKQDVLVLTNLESRGLSYGQVKIVRQWVKDGGHLVILGGLLTLGQANNMALGWPEFLPVELAGPYEVRKCEPPVVFGVPDRQLGVAIKAWQKPPLVMYRHMVRAKPGAKVLIAGTKKEPLLVGQSYGKGTVAVFTGTTLGDPPAGGTAFWQSPAWPGILAAAVNWRG